jgi:CHAT domain-containing protein
LTADEIASLKLDKTRLVVLPACYSALGQAAGGEGLLGIQRAFQAAGARATIGALWAVNDAVTQKLMTMVYHNMLREKQSALDALRNAQLQLLRELRGDLPASATMRGVDPPDGAAGKAAGAPYFWAAFTLSGDWR